MSNEIVFAEKSEKIKNSSDKYITGYVDNDGAIVFYSSIGEDRALSVATIAVFVGGAFVGYLTSSIIDGIVISATRQSSGEWVATAIKNVLGKKYTGVVQLPSYGPFTCPGVVIDHSGTLCKGY